MTALRVGVFAITALVACSVSRAGMIIQSVDRNNSASVHIYQTEQSPEASDFAGVSSHALGHFSDDSTAAAGFDLAADPPRFANGIAHAFQESTVNNFEISGSLAVDAALAMQGIYAGIDGGIEADARVDNWVVVVFDVTEAAAYKLDVLADAFENAFVQFRLSKAGVFLFDLVGYDDLPIVIDEILALNPGRYTFDIWASAPIALSPPTRLFADSGSANASFSLRSLPEPASLELAALGIAGAVLAWRNVRSHHENKESTNDRS
jgi:hypothetical protein